MVKRLSVPRQLMPLLAIAAGLLAAGAQDAQEAKHTGREFDSAAILSGPEGVRDWRVGVGQARVTPEMSRFGWTRRPDGPFMTAAKGDGLAAHCVRLDVDVQIEGDTLPFPWPAAASLTCLKASSIDGPYSRVATVEMPAVLAEAQSILDYKKTLSRSARLRRYSLYWTDLDVKPGQRWYYRIAVQDAAGQELHRTGACSAFLLQLPRLPGIVGPDAFFFPERACVLHG